MYSNGADIDTDFAGKVLDFSCNLLIVPPVYINTCLVFRDSISIVPQCSNCWHLLVLCILFRGHIVDYVV